MRKLNMYNQQHEEAVVASVSKYNTLFSLQSETKVPNSVEGDWEYQRQQLHIYWPHPAAVWLQVGVSSTEASFWYDSTHVYVAIYYRHASMVMLMLMWDTRRLRFTWNQSWSCGNWKLSTFCLADSFAFSSETSETTLVNGKSAGYELHSLFKYSLRQNYL